MKKKHFWPLVILVVIAVWIGISITIARSDVYGPLGKSLRAASSWLRHFPRNASITITNTGCKLVGGEMTSRSLGGLGMSEHVCLKKTGTPTSDGGKSCQYDKDCQSLCLGASFPPDVQGGILSLDSQRFTFGNTGSPGSCSEVKIWKF